MGFDFIKSSSRPLWKRNALAVIPQAQKSSRAAFGSIHGPRCSKVVTPVPRSFPAMPATACSQRLFVMRMTS